MIDYTFSLLGGSTWLNLVNTQFMHNKQIRDVFSDTKDAHQWLKANQLLRESDLLSDTNSFHKLCTELISLRELCLEVVSSLEQHEELSKQLILSLKERTERLSIVAVIHAQEGKGILSYEGKNTIEFVLHRVISSIFDTLEHYPPERTRKCEHEECMLHFVDTSKGGKRRWCSMEVCGNRHKAAEFYAKKKRSLTPELTDQK